MKTVAVTAPSHAAHGFDRSWPSGDSTAALIFSMIPVFGWQPSDTGSESEYIYTGPGSPKANRKSLATLPDNECMTFAVARPLLGDRNQDVQRVPQPGRPLALTHRNGSRDRESMGRRSDTSSARQRIRGQGSNPAGPMIARRPFLAHNPTQTRAPPPLQSSRRVGGAEFQHPASHPRPPHSLSFTRVRCQIPRRVTSPRLQVLPSARVCYALPRNLGHWTAHNGCKGRCLIGLEPGDSGYATTSPVCHKASQTCVL